MEISHDAHTKQHVRGAQRQMPSVLLDELLYDVVLPPATPILGCNPNPNTVMPNLSKLCTP